LSEQVLRPSVTEEKENVGGQFWFVFGAASLVNSKYVPHRFAAGEHE
jgi:hypothetical protein